MRGGGHGKGIKKSGKNVRKWKCEKGEVENPLKKCDIIFEQ